MNLIVYDGLFAICRLDPGDDVPSWSSESPFLSITRSRDELSIVCSQHVIPQTIRCSGNWRLLRIEGVLDLQLTGVLSNLLAPLAVAGVTVFVLSTFDTDYVMVPVQMLDRACGVMKAEGHRIFKEKGDSSLNSKN
jgi:hypothetical protein